MEHAEAKQLDALINELQRFLARSLLVGVEGTAEDDSATDDDEDRVGAGVREPDVLKQQHSAVC